MVMVAENGLRRESDPKGGCSVHVCTAPKLCIHIDRSWQRHRRHRKGVHNVSGLLASPAPATFASLQSSLPLVTCCLPILLLPTEPDQRRVDGLTVLSHNRLRLNPLDTTTFAASADHSSTCLAPSQPNHPRKRPSPPPELHPYPRNLRCIDGSVLCYECIGRLLGDVTQLRDPFTESGRVSRRYVSRPRRAPCASTLCAGWRFVVAIDGGWHFTLPHIIAAACSGPHAEAPG